MILFGLEDGGVEYPWKSATIICLLIFGFISFLIFGFVEWKVAKYPIIPLRIFKHHSNLAALFVCFFHGYVFIGGSYYLPLYFQTILDCTPILSGVYVLPTSVALSIGSIATGIFIRKTGMYLPGQFTIPNVRSVTMYTNGDCSSYLLRSNNDDTRLRTLHQLSSRKKLASTYSIPRHCRLGHRPPVPSSSQFVHVSTRSVTITNMI